jgi:hypothetical protein
MNIKEAMVSTTTIHPTTIVVTDDLIAKQPPTRDPYEIDVGHNELVEDESDENE